MPKFEQPSRPRRMILGVVLLLTQITAASAQNRPKIEFVPNLAPETVLSATISPDGLRLISGGQDTTLKLWDAATGHLVRVFHGHTDWVGTVVFSPDGSRLLSGSDDKTLKLWDAVTGRSLLTFEGHSAGVTSVAFSPDASRVISGSRDKTLILWDAATGQVLRRFQGHSDRVSSVAFSPDGTRVVSGSGGSLHSRAEGHDKTLKLWDATTGQLLRTFEGHSAGVTSVAFSPNGGLLLSGSEDKTLKLWDVTKAEPVRTFQGHAGPVWSIAFSPDGTRVLSGSHDKTMRLWDSATGQLLRTFGAASEYDRPTSVAFASDGTRVLWGGIGIDTLRLLDVETGLALRTVGGRIRPVYSVAFSPDGRRLLSGNLDNTVKLWDAATGQLVRTFKGHSTYVRSVASSPDGARLLSGSDDKTLKLWDVATGQLLQTYQGHSNSVWSVLFSPDGTRLISGSRDRSIKVWDATTGQLLRTMDGHIPVTAMAITPDGTRLVSAGVAKTLELWDVATGQLLRTFEGHTSSVWTVAFSPDGTRLVSGGADDTVRLWEVATSQLLRTFKAHSGWVRAVAFTSDGTHLLSGGDEETLKLWDLATGQLLRTLEGNSLVDSAAISPDGAHALSGNVDGTMTIWDLSTAKSMVSLMATPDDEWLSITREGFFAASRNGSEMLGVVRGLDLYSAAQFRDHLYRADLIEQMLKGDPEGRYKDATFKLSLEKILDSGPAPQIELVPGRKTEWINATTARTTVRLVDSGGGVGNKVVWRVNGVTQGDIATGGTPEPAVIGNFRLVTQSLRIDPAQTNVIEVVAYNGAGLLATVPFAITVDRFGASTEKRPKMYVLAVGVSDYARKDWTLQYPVKDARSVGELLRIAARGLYDDIDLSLVLDTDATAKGIEAAVNRVANKANPNDVFVLFIAGHGRSIAGTYYFLPQNLNFEAGRTVEKDAIGQDQLQAWLAKITAQKSILILDTCESATATRSLDTERETAVERLSHATGRSIITAASNAAFEGYEGHGLLTYVVLDTFSKPGGGGNDEIDLYRLARHVDRMVPIISQRVFGEPQRPQNKIEGNFPLGVRVAALTTPTTETNIPKTPTHVLSRAEPVREQPQSEAAAERTLSPGTLLRVIDVVGDWAIVARDGQKLGYVPMDSLLQLQ